MAIELFANGISPAALDAVQRSGGKVERNQPNITGKVDSLHIIFPEGTRKQQGYAIWVLPGGVKLESYGRLYDATIRILEEFGMDTYHPTVIKTI